jgi:hypothetical protein
MIKVEYTLKHFFSKPIVDLLLPHLINAERTPLQGVEKHELVMAAFQKTIHSDNVALPTPEGNLSVPWKILFPLIINAICRILNITCGKEWIKEVPQNELPPPG